MVANLIAGYTMTYHREFRVSDRIEVVELRRDVSQIGLMVTHLRSIKNEELVLPNSLILNSKRHQLDNSRAGTGLILHTAVGIGYEAL
jgi:small-conductance mechanosensitive channel